MAELRRRDLLRCLLRSFALQGSWSFEGMQSLGFAYAAEPALRRLYPQEEAFEAARRRHLGFFNTHPFLAATILGAVIRMERDGADEAELQRVKTLLMGPCGAMGDSCFWGGLKPLAVVAAVTLALQGHLWAPWVVVAVCTAVNAGVRAAGFLEGYRLGLAVVGEVPNWHLIPWAQRLKRLTASILGMAVAVGALSGPVPGWGIPPALVLAGAGALAVVFAWVIARGVRTEWILAAAVAAGVALGAVP